MALTTLASIDEAKRLARALVGERLCACVNVVPGLRSIYTWQGRLHEDEEVLLILKTTSAKWAKLRPRLLALHPYDVPELIAWRAPHTAPAYLRWLVDSTS